MSEGVREGETGRERERDRERYRDRERETDRRQGSMYLCSIGTYKYCRGRCLL